MIAAPRLLSDYIVFCRRVNVSVAKVFCKYSGQFMQIPHMVAPCPQGFICGSGSHYNAAPVTADLSALRGFLDSDILSLYVEIPREDKRAAWRSIIDKIIVDRNGSHAVYFLR